MNKQLILDTKAAIESVKARAGKALVKGDTTEFLRLMGEVEALKQVLEFECPGIFNMPKDSIRLTDSIYETMLDNDEMWVLGENGNAAIVSDAALMDN